MRCSPTDLSISVWAGVLQLLTSQQLSCSVAIGSTMQQFEREVQYRCGSVSVSGMGSSTKSSSVVDVGQQAKHQQHRSNTQDLVMHGLMYY